MAIADINEVATKTKPLRVERHWIGGHIVELEVCHIPIEHLFFNIENGRYADRMIRLRHDHSGTEIDPKQEKWKGKIEKMLAGEHKDTSRDQAAFQKLTEDIKNRTQLRPGVVGLDGGVLDGNRRLAALRRLSKENREQFRTFDAVILPKTTTSEDRWRIEAGLQLGVNERWDYSPINELLKVRDGVRLYEEMIRSGKAPKGTDPIQQVAKAIYGKTEAQIREMVSRLDLIDEYLRFLKRPGAYDEIGPISERFLEATRVIQAAENNQKDPAFLAKLKAVLFFVIDQDKMKNWDVRRIYDSLGGDPKKRGPKRASNEAALKEFLAQFPDAKKIQEALVASREPPPSPKPKPERGPSAKKKGPPPKAPKQPQPPKPVIDTAKVDAATKKFTRTMETMSEAKSPRKIAAGAIAEITALHSGLSKKDVRESLTVDDRAAVVEIIATMQKLLTECVKQLKKS